MIYEDRPPAHIPARGGARRPTGPRSSGPVTIGTRSFHPGGAWQRFLIDAARPHLVAPSKPPMAVTMRKINPEYVEAVKNLANNSPYFRLVSMVLREIGPGHCLLDVALREKHTQAFGYVHGGVFASIIDTAAFWAAYCELDEDAIITSVDLKINYLAPVQNGTLSARGRRIKMGKTLGLAEAEISDAEGKIVAHGTSTLMVLRGPAIQGPAALPPKFLD